MLQIPPEVGPIIMILWQSYSQPEIKKPKISDLFLTVKKYFVHSCPSTLFVESRVASAYFFLGSILITVSVHTDREKVSTKPLIILIKALNEGLSAILL